MRHIRRKRMPLLPLSVLIFYSIIVVLRKTGITPHPATILTILENLYHTYGLRGLFIGALLEGIVYVGLYFPGSFIVALAVILSNGTRSSLAAIALTVAIALTITSCINYFLGRCIGLRRSKKQKLVQQKKLPKTLLPAMIHPNILALYFFHAGIYQKHPIQLLYVPVIMFPYGLLLGYILFLLKHPVRQAVEQPYIMFIAICVWFVVACVYGYLIRTKRNLLYRYIPNKTAKDIFTLLHEN